MNSPKRLSEHWREVAALLRRATASWPATRDLLGPLAAAFEQCADEYDARDPAEEIARYLESEAMLRADPDAGEALEQAAEEIRERWGKPAEGDPQ